ncbi:uncharacterized protein LOC110464882 [Mizuhopecten yessoensis]|uniref:Uncharacterized protein n=1 Tax=Mizuhopecten yessoensis TaxID=6573 RepID=A0A210PSX1_MIZYE|nr:uncharacterized protein LOC110464882 [Mizuhopecten yessoensis]XP_021376011.1 uncharacterized protein LOC110464882 [Mizuhopecten yessoensis]OWF39583.1 hypothetical protein KP79_PYT03967 [Mizuhopecten yessoensis]
MAEHSGLRILLILLTLVVYIVMVVFNALGGSVGQEIGLFKNTTGEISNLFRLQITPAGWTFSIWGVIYAWQALWLIYALTTICRKTKSGSYFYQLPVLPPSIYILYIINNIANVAWLFVWDSQEIIWSLVVIAITPITLYVALAISFQRLYHNLGNLNKENAVKDIWLIRFLVQNGMALYAAWVTIATLLNVSMVMIYKGNVSNEDSCTVVLGILSFFIGTWVVLDNTILDPYVRYTFSPYITITVALGGVVAKNYDLALRERNSLFSLTLLIIAAVLLVTKFIIMTVRHFRDPISPKIEYEPTI